DLEHPPTPVADEAAPGSDVLGQDGAQAGGSLMDERPDDPVSGTSAQVAVVDGQHGQQEATGEAELADGASADGEEALAADGAAEPSEDATATVAQEAPKEVPDAVAKTAKSEAG